MPSSDQKWQASDLESAGAAVRTISSRQDRWCRREPTGCVLVEKPLDLRDDQKSLEEQKQIDILLSPW
jgi:hypothetical protein